MKLILARHGNTFSADDTPLWVGAREDFPLVARGVEQASHVADALIRANLRPDQIIAGPLLRTRTGAEIIAARTGFSGDIMIDDRLKEIDYGSWGGKSDAEIEQLYGGDVITAWREHSVRPENADWMPDEATLEQHAMSVLNDVTHSTDEDDTVLLVTSNGILRFYHALLYAGQANAPSGKVKTGHLCYAEYHNKTWRPECWNVSPESFMC